MTVIVRLPARRATPRIQSLQVALAAARAILKNLRNRMTVARLAEMPDYLLSDLGVRRDDVHDALNQTWHDDPSFRLAVTASRRRRSHEMTF
ncbi:DUF1127 domain-containing protein [Mangrovibrevibacter kandeliae]|uniref:DUF1127 domain-containing protein n=1 Tax=Mangrovibrevibacter kandeliae TaxID=2968473 RepID=UPI0021176D55|nr:MULTISPECIES: DUF1127 domain-containing protein [unclassified Aurantimonas]MCQ8780789.1 DUF1127 domain-containing protein [Aurantimonas sp. CSK15Z-1]MCW4113570.1 DUF1127 domain-containing protein [Aurantimonas sp. MSK8Z-1]